MATTSVRHSTAVNEVPGGDVRGDIATLGRECPHGSPVLLRAMDEAA